HVLEQFQITAREIIDSCAFEVVRHHRRVATVLTRRIFIRQQQHSFDVGVAIPNQLGRKILTYRRQVNVSLDLVLAQQRLRHQLDFFRRLHVKKRNLAIETARAFQIDVEFVGTIRHHQEQYAPAIRGVRHELLDTRDDTRRRAAIPFPVSVAKSTIAFVDDHYDLTDSANHVQDLFEIALSRAHPLRTKVLQLDRRQPALFRKRFRNERLSSSHWTGKQNSHRNPTRPAFANAFGNNEQIFLHFVHPSDNFKPVHGLDKLHQPKTLALENLAFAFGDESVSLLARALNGARNRRLRHNSSGRDELFDFVTTQAIRQRREFVCACRGISAIA